MPPLTNKPILFSTFNVTSQVFHITPLSYAFVNLKPLLPGHVLVSPLRVVPRLSDLTPPEIKDLFLTVQRVSRMIERVYDATALNIAMQDGVDAGQSVPHVHAHIIPRKPNDEGEGDKIYEMQEGEEGDIGAWMEWRARGRPKFPKIEEAGRKPRTEKEMEDEAEMLAKEMQKEESYKL